LPFHALRIRRKTEFPMTTFSDLGLIAPLLRAVTAEGYTTPTPIQAQSIPQLLAGRDLLGIAQTGTGKTAAFTLPILQRLAANPKRPGARSARALVLTPTRELACQIHDSFAAYGRNLRLKRSLIFGGVAQGPQVSRMAGGSDIVIATPGRLLDLIEQGHVRLGGIEICVLDEADRMLDMGFVRDVRKIMSMMPEQRQTMLFSATMPSDIADLADSILKDFHRVEVTPAATTVERIGQKVLFVDRQDKRRLLIDLLKGETVGRTIVFTRTKRGADRLVEQLAKGGVTADSIHGNKSQNARQRALAAFRKGRLTTLVATDIAARGIDVDGVTHVINFELPIEPESYVHRIGRTARAGAEGVALSFCDAEEVDHLRAIEKTIRQAVPVEEAHAYHAEAVRELHRAANTNRPGGGKAKRRFGGGRQASAKRPAQGQAARKARRGGRRNGGFAQAPSGQRKAS
jgi:ATP-dependent RNA helicase RhlE